MIEPVQAHCPYCNGKRSCDTHGTICKNWYYETPCKSFSSDGGVIHSLLECRGCNTVFYETSSFDSENVDYRVDVMGETQCEYIVEKVTYPKPDAKIKPKWLLSMYQVDDILHNILNEMYIACNNQCYVLAAIGLRTALDRATEVLKIDPAISFAEKLEALQRSGWIGDTEKEILSIVTDAGNAAAHRGWKPQGKDIADLVCAMEIFLQRAFITGKAPLAIKKIIPAKPKKLKVTPAT
jgi:Domain of unknown function (DUF4145)